MRLQCQKEALFKTEVEHYPVAEAHGRGILLCSISELGGIPPKVLGKNNQPKEHADEKNEAEEKQKRVGHGERRKALAQTTTPAVKPANIELTLLSRADMFMYRH